jgi:hypothetical protein
MLNIIVCWKVVSLFCGTQLPANIESTISMEQRHITHTLEWLPHYTITTAWNIRSNENT